MNQVSTELLPSFSIADFCLSKHQYNDLVLFISSSLNDPGGTQMLKLRCQSGGHLLHTRQEDFINSLLDTFTGGVEVAETDPYKLRNEVVKLQDKREQL